MFDVDGAPLVSVERNLQGDPVQHVERAIAGIDEHGADVPVHVSSDVDAAAVAASINAADCMVDALADFARRRQ